MVPGRTTGNPPSLPFPFNLCIQSLLIMRAFFWRPRDAASKILAPSPVPSQTFRTFNIVARPPTTPLKLPNKLYTP